MHSRHFLRSSLALTVFAITGGSLQAQTIHTWNAGSGLWTDAAKWTGGVPGGATADVRIDGGVTGTDSIVQLPSLGGLVTVGKLQIDSGDLLLLDPSQGLRLSASGFAGAGVLTVNGTLSIPGFTGSDSLSLGDTATPVTLNGTGSIQLGGTGSMPEVTGKEVTNQTRLSGSFVLGLVDDYNNTSTPKMHNEGLILANIAGSPIVLYGGEDFNATGAVTDPRASTNTGTIKAGAHATLVIGTGAWNNTDGEILADGEDAKVVFSHATKTEGGILNTANGGLIEIAGAGNPKWKNLTIEGDVIFTTNSTLQIEGTITNNGTITMPEDTTGSVDLTLNSVSTGQTVTLAGNGTIFIDRVAHWTVGHLGASSGRLLNAGNTIHGRGNIGVRNGSDAMDLTNRGLIVADQNDGYLNVAANDLINEPGGVLRASDDGILVLNVVQALTNTGGTVEALSGGKVEAVAARVLGGTVRNVGGEIVLNNWTLVNPTAGLEGMNTQGLLTLEDNQSMRLVKAIKNEGTIHARSTGNWTTIRLGESGAQTVTLHGNGTIRLGDPGSASEGSRLGTDEYELTNLINADQTIAGFGLIGRADEYAEYLQITNQDVIKADADGKRLRAWVRGIDNTAGQLFAENGGTLALYATHGIINTGSTIEAKAGSTVTVENPTRITGGTLAGNAGDTLPDDEVGFFIGSTTLVTPTIVGIVSLPDNRTARLVGNQTINGTLRTNSTANRTDFIIGEAGNPNVELNGTGQIKLGHTGGDSWLREDTTGVTLTVNIPISGFGNFGDYDRREMTLVNNNTITGDSPGKYMSFHPEVLTNSAGGVIRATGGGIVWMNIPTIHNGGAELRAESGSILSLGGGSSSDRVINGGTLRAMAGGTVKLPQGITARSGLKIENDGIVELGLDEFERHFHGLDNGGSEFSNRGKIQKVGSGEFHLKTTLKTELAHPSEIETLSGILRLYGGGTVAGTTITTAAGAQTGFHGPEVYTFSGENTFNGDGTHFTANVTLSLANEATKINAKNLTFLDSTSISGQSGVNISEVNVSGELIFPIYSNTTLHNVKLLTAEGSTALVNRQGSGVHFTGDARWENRGVVTVQDSSNINGASTTAFVTTPTGKVVFTDNATMNIPCVIQNEGKWQIETPNPCRVTLATGGNFMNAKMVVADTGSEWFFTGGSAYLFSGQANEFLVGGLAVLNNTTMTLNRVGGSTPDNDAVISSSAIVRFQGVGSVVAGDGVVFASRGFDFESGGLVVNRARLRNEGMAGYPTLWRSSGGALSFTNGARFENNSRFLILTPMGDVVGEDGTLFHNMAGGTIVHQASGTTNFLIDFQNDGEVEFAAGEFYFLKASTGRGGVATSNGAKTKLDYSQATPDEMPKWVKSTGTDSAAEFTLPPGQTANSAVEALTGGTVKMIGPDGATMVAAGAGNVMAKNAAGIVAAGGMNLQSDARAGIVAAGAGNVIVNNGGNVTAQNGGSVISTGTGSLVQANKIVAAGAGNMVAAGAGNMVAAGAGNMVAAGAGNLTQGAASALSLTALKTTSSPQSEAAKSKPTPSSLSLDEETGVFGLDAIVAKVEALNTDPDVGVIFVDTGSQARAEGGGSIVAENDGILAGAGTFVGPGRIESGGTLMPGSYIGALTWTGNLDIQNGGKLDIEIGGTAAGQFDAVNVSGSLIMEGQLKVHFANNFQNTIQATDVFNIATAGSAITGTIDNLSGGRVTTSDGRGSFAVQFTNEGKTLTLTGYQSAGPTFTNWAAEKGLTGDDALPTADPDFDGIPNLLEYALGLEPQSASESPTQSGTVEVSGQHYLTLTYTRPAGSDARPDITYTGESSTTLAPLDWSAAGVIVHSVTLQPGGLLETVILSSTSPIGAGNEFMRLRVEL